MTRCFGNKLQDIIAGQNKLKVRVELVRENSADPAHRTWSAKIKNEWNEWKEFLSDYVNILLVIFTLVILPAPFCYILCLGAVPLLFLIIFVLPPTIIFPPFFIILFIQIAFHLHVLKGLIKIINEAITNRNISTKHRNIIYATGCFCLLLIAFYFKIYSFGTAAGNAFYGNIVELVEQITNLF